MKRGTPRHPKIAHLRQLLKVGLAAAVGYLELLWHFTAEFAPKGDVGRFSDERIEGAMDWHGKSGRLVAALTESGWLDHHSECRLCVHDWAHHADEAVKKRLSRLGLKFVEVGARVTEHCPDIDREQAKASRQNPVMSRPPEPVPEPEPVPTPERVACVSTVMAPETSKMVATTVETTTMPDLFPEFMGIFLAAGKLLNDRDKERALKLWLNFEAGEHATILEHLKRSVTDGTWSDARYTPMPASYLESKAWSRIGPGRILPRTLAQTRAENAQQRAEARFLGGDQ